MAITSSITYHWERFLENGPQPIWIRDGLTRPWIGDASNEADEI